MHLLRSLKRWLTLAVLLMALTVAMGSWSAVSDGGVRDIDWDGMLLACLRAAAFTAVLWVAWQAIAACLSLGHEPRRWRRRERTREADPPVDRHGFGYESALTQHDFACLAALSKATGVSPPRVIGLALDCYIDELDGDDRSRFEYYLDRARTTQQARH